MSQRSLFGAALDGTFGAFLRRMPKQSRSRALVTAVVQALDEQLQSGRDLDAVTIETVSERAGVSVGSFYEYFTGKDSLLGALVGQVTDRNFRHLSARLEAHAVDGLDALVRAFSRDIATTYLAHPRHMRVVVHAIGRLGLLGIVNRERDRFAEVMCTHARPFLSDEDPARVLRTMQLLADGAMGVLVAAADRESPADAEAVAEELAELAFGLIAQRHASSAP
ncbi:MAG: TetR/AcrR family transcriptional regulator [Myxococcota bacterium]